MLLYAKTDEDIVPDADFVIGGNAFSVKTLDLSQDFRVIRSQLDRIAFTLRQGAVEVP
jgi:5-methylcytosine-specific restriction enzyme subunit McrC